MEPWQIALIIIGVVLFLLLGGVVFSICFTMPIAERLYQTQWVRQNEEKFKRGCSDASFDYHLDMFNQGMKYRDSVIEKIKNVEIISLGDKLVGEYYDFGFEKTIIIMPGRMETCLYGAYYVEPFYKSGYNVLCIDPRAHGLSEGKLLTLGKKEAIDAINWAKFLHDTFNIKKVALYGLCGGATASCLALANSMCPPYLNTFIADGMFYSFFRVYKRHIIDEKKPVYPVILEVMHLIKKRNNVNPYKCAPNKIIKTIKPELLVLSGENDKFAYSEEARIMCKSCLSIDKTFALIKNGRHSHLRYDNKNDYDEAVINFLKSHWWKETYGKDITS